MLALPPHSVVLLTPSILSLSLSSLFLQAIVNICAVAQGTDIAGEKKKKEKRLLSTVSVSWWYFAMWI